MDLVSIIIPIYNIEKYLDRCIASAVGQTYQNIEVLLVDDGSTDRSPAICDNWASKDQRVQVIHQKNSGVSAARNTGLRIAKGSYILQLDSDDYMATFTVQRLVDTAQKTAADMVICDFERGTQDNYVFTQTNDPTVQMVQPQETLERIYCGDSDALRYTVPWCKIYRKELLENVVYPEGKIFEDIYVTHTILWRCRSIALLEEKLFYYYRRADSIMNATFSLKKLDYLQAMVERIDFFRGNGMTELAQTAYDELLHSLVWEYSRTRDLINSQEGMDYVTRLFRENYRKGYSSHRYPEETARFLGTFYRNPERVIWYWRISSKLKKIFKRG